MIQIGRILATTALLGLMALMPTRASAATLVPFQASVFEHFTLSLCGPWTVCIDAQGTGQATALGRVSESASVRVDINPADAVGGCTPETRSTTLVAANGDEITMSATGCGYLATNSARDLYVVTGGTGRFQGASGSGTESNVYTMTGPGMGVAWVTFAGTLSSPRSPAA